MVAQTTKSKQLFSDMPSRDAIRALTAQIRRRWNEEEHQRRAQLAMRQQRRLFFQEHAV